MQKKRRRYPPRFPRVPKASRSSPLEEQGVPSRQGVLELQPVQDNREVLAGPGGARG